MNIDDYKKPAWANFCRVLGVICFLIFAVLAIISCIEYYGGKLHAEVLLFVGIAIGSLIHFFFVAWCIETFSDIRHYARETAIALTSGKEEKKAEDTKPNASQEQWRSKGLRWISGNS